MKKVLISLLAISALTVMLASCSSSPSSPNPPTPETHDVSMVDSAFVPVDLTINEGDTVRWTNNGARVHTATSGTNGVPNGIWDSGDIAVGISFERVFNTAGTFPYYCTHHFLTGMTGTITVVTP